METVDAVLEKVRKPGRPRAIPEEMEPVLVDLYRNGHGYRAIARILRSGHGLNPLDCTPKAGHKGLGVPAELICSPKTGPGKMLVLWDVGPHPFLVPAIMLVLRS